MLTKVSAHVLTFHITILLFPIENAHIKTKNANKNLRAENENQTNNIKLVISKVIILVPPRKLCQNVGLDR